MLLKIVVTVSQQYCYIQLVASWHYCVKSFSKPVRMQNSHKDSLATIQVMDRPEEQITYLPCSKQIVKYCHAFCAYLRLPEAKRGENKKQSGKRLSVQFYSPQSGSIHIFTPQKIAATFAGHVQMLELPVGRPECYSKWPRQAERVSLLDFLAGKNLSRLKYHTVRILPLGITRQTQNHPEITQNSASLVKPNKSENGETFHLWRRVVVCNIRSETSVKTPCGSHI